MYLYIKNLNNNVLFVTSCNDRQRQMNIITYIYDTIALIIKSNKYSMYVTYRFLDYFTIRQIIIACIQSMSKKPFQY